jgi:uncharacterized protein
MATVDHTMTLQAEPAKVFEYLTDPEKETVWQSSLLEARFSGPMQQGTRITEVRKFLGRRMESTVEVTELEPQRLFAGRVLSGPVPWEFRYALEGTDGATHLSFHAEGEPGRFFRLAEPLVVRALKKQLENDFSTLKEIVESG